MNQIVQELKAEIQEDGRLIYTPHPAALDSQSNVGIVFEDGEKLLDVLQKAGVENLHTGALSVYVNGTQVVLENLDTYPLRHGDIIAVRGNVGRAALQIVALAALAYFTVMTAGAAGGVGGALMGVGTNAAIYVNAAVMIGGGMLINRVLGPKMPKMGGSELAQSYSLTSTSNANRKYDPVPLILGVVWQAPDLSSNAYYRYEGDEQYLHFIMNAGINVNRYEGELLVGETPLSSYEDHQVWNSGYPGMPEQPIPLYSNADTIAVGEVTPAGPPVTRTTSDATKVIEIDMNYLLYDIGSKGDPGNNAFDVTIRIAPAGTTNWQTTVDRVNHAKTEPLKKTYTFPVATGKYDVQVQVGEAYWHEGNGNDESKATWAALRSIQEDTATYRGTPRTAIRVRATGLANGTLEAISGKFFANPMPFWNGNAWATATNENNGLDNPGAQLLLLARGIYDDEGRLLAGLGLPDDMIDIESLKVFMSHCTANGLRCNMRIDDTRSIGELMDTIALCGLGQVSHATGKFGVVFAWEAQPLSGVANMATMKQGSFKVDYTLSSKADGIEYTYFDLLEKKEKTIRVKAPGVGTSINLIRLSGEGVSTAEHAAIMARYHLGQSLYQFKAIEYATNLEHLDFRRMDVLSVTHDLTKWGTGGMLMKATRQPNGDVVLRLDAPVPASNTPYAGLRVPGEKLWRVMPCVPPAEGAKEITILAANWQNDIPLPEGADAYNYLWIYDVKQTPGYRVRVASIQPESDLSGAAIAVVPESQEFWNYVIRGVYEPANNESLLPQRQAPRLINVNVDAGLDTTGDVARTALHVSFDVDGYLSYAEVWAAPPEAELSYRGRTSGRSLTFIPEAPGDWRIQIRPFGATLPGAPVTVPFLVNTTSLVPWNYTAFDVTGVTGGMRRYHFSYDNGVQAPLNLAGAVIRYNAGATALPWSEMTPLGGESAIHTASFDSILPAAGQWTFAIRAISTSGVLSTSIRYKTVTLSDNFGAGQTPDLTAPPKPTAPSAVSALTSAIITQANPVYTQGHGHKDTALYVAQVTTAKPNPTTADATLAANFLGLVYAYPAAPGAQLRFWTKWRSNDNVLSATFSDPVTVTVGKLGNVNIGDDLDVAGRLADGSITPEKILGQIPRNKIEDGTSIPETIPAGQPLPTQKVTDMIIYNGQVYVWNGTNYTRDAVSGINFSDLGGQIAPGQIANETLTASMFAAGIEPVKTLASVPTTKNGSVIYVGKDIYRWDSTTNKYEKSVAAADVTGQLVGTQIAAATLTAEKFANGIQPVGVVSGSVVPTVKSQEVITVAGKLYRWDSTTNKYERNTAAADIAGQITGAQIADAAIGVAKFAAGIGPVGLATGALPAVKSTDVLYFGNELYRWSTATGKYEKSISATDLVGQIVATQINDGAITTPKLAANSVAAGNIQALAITAGKIAVGAVGATEIAADAILTRHLAVKARGPIISPDPYLEEYTAWGNPSGTIVLDNTAVGGRAVQYTGPNSGFAFHPQRIAIETGKNYRVEIDAKAVSGASPCYLTVQFLDGNGANITGTTAGTTGWGGLGSYFYFGRVNQAPTASWTSYGINFGPNSEASIPANARYFTIGVLPAYTGTGVNAFSNFLAYERQDANLIVDGVITAAKVAANAINATHLAANSVTSIAITAEAITAAKVAAGAIGTTHLQAYSIVSSKVVISETENFVPNASFVTGTFAGWNQYTSPNNMWVLAAGAAGVPANAPAPNVAKMAGVCALLAGDGSAVGFENYLPVKQGEQYVMSADFAVDAALSGGASDWRLIAATLDTAGATGNTTIANLGALANASVGTWLSTSGTYTVPAGIRGLRLYVYRNYGGGNSYITNLGLRRKNSGELIVDGAITAGKVAADSITASKMVLTGAQTAINRDPNFTDAAVWETTTNNSNAAPNFGYVTSASGFVAGTCLYPTNPTGTGDAGFWIMDKQMYSVSATKTYRGSVNLFQDPGGNRTAYLGVNFYNSAGAYLSTSPNWGAAWSGYIASGVTPPGGKFTMYSGDFGAGTDKPIPPTAAYMRVGVILNYGASGTANTRMAAQHVRIEEKNAASLIVSGGIIADFMAANSVTSVAVAANTINSTHITAGAIVAGKVAASAIGTNELAARAITVSKLAVSGAADAVNIDPMMTDAGYWNYNNFASRSIVQVTDGYAGDTVLQTTATVEDYYNAANQLFPVDAAKDYLLEFVVRRVSGTGTFYGVAQFFNGAGSQLQFPVEGWSSGYQGNFYMPAAVTTATNTWTRYTLAIGPNSPAKFPAGTAKMALGYLSGYGNGGVWQIGLIRLTRRNGGELIVDGQITASKMAADSIAANNLQANSVVFGKLAVNSVGADNILANAITATKILAGSIGTSHLSASSVTTEKLTIGNFTNLVPNPIFAGGLSADWSLTSATLVASNAAGVPANASTPFVVAQSGAAAHGVSSHGLHVGNAGYVGIELQPGESYRISVDAAAGAGANGSVTMYLWGRLGTGATGTALGSLVLPLPVGGAWGTYSTTVTIPAGSTAKFGQLYMYRSAGAGSTYFTNARITRMSDANLIVDGQITAAKLAANSIVVGTAAIANGAIVDAMIGNLSATKITAGTLDAARIGAGTINSGHLGANSVTSNAITAGAINADKIGVMAVTSVHIYTGAVTADKLSVGRSANLCPDATFTPGLAFWGKFNTHDFGGGFNVGVNYNGGGEWAATGSPTLYVEQTNTWYNGQPITTHNKQVYSAPISCLPGDRLELSVYVGAHRCDAQLLVQFLNPWGGLLSSTPLGTALAGGPGGGRALSNYLRLGGFGTAPAGTGYARLVMVTGVTKPGEPNCYTFWTRPFVGLASANQTELSPWSPNTNTEILPDGITTATLAAKAANIGDLVIQPGVGRNGTLSVYDMNNNPTFQVLANGQTVMQQANVISTLQIAGNAVSIIRGQEIWRSNLTGNPEAQFFFNNYDSGGADIIVRMSSSHMHRSKIRIRRNAVWLREEFYIGSTEFIIANGAGLSNWEIYDTPDLPGDGSGFSIRTMVTMTSFKR